MKFTIVIPCYNEENTIIKILKKIETYHQRTDFEVIIVNDGSTDKTQTKIQSYIKQEPKIKNIALVNKEKNEGKGQAIVSAIRIARGEYIAIQDADREYYPKDLFRIFDIIDREDWEVVYGSRIMKTNPYHSPYYFYGSRLITWFYNLLFQDKLTDLSTGYKIFKKSLIEPSQLKAKRFGFCAELTCLLNKAKVKIMEVPISYEPRSFSEGKKISTKDGIEFIWIISKHYFTR